MTDKPPGYPFPDDELVYCSAYDGFDPDANSYVALARLPKDHTVEVNGKEHNNSHRLVVHSPVRGPECFLVNPGADWLALLCAVLNLMAEDPDRHGGEGKASFVPSFVGPRAGVDLGSKVELTAEQARELASLLRSLEEDLIAEFATEPVELGQTEGGEWADWLEREAEE